VRIVALRPRISAAPCAKALSSSWRWWRQGALVLDNRDELDRNPGRALVEKLEHRVLGVGADPAPDHRGGRPADRLAAW
jgi:hypothetical protein